MFVDYHGLSDPELEMQFIEQQLNMWLKAQPGLSDEEVIDRSVQAMS